MMYSQQLSELRAHGEYSPAWLLVPLAFIAVLLGVWFTVVEGGSTDDAMPVFTDSIDSVPAPSMGFSAMAGPANAAELRRPDVLPAPERAPVVRRLQPEKGTLPAKHTVPARAPREPVEPAAGETAHDHWRHHGVG